MVDAYLENLDNSQKEYKLNDEYGLIHLDSGEARVYINNQKKYLKEPYYVFLNPNDEVKILSTKQATYKIFIISSKNLFSLSPHEMPSQYYDLRNKDFSAKFLPSSPYSSVILNLYYNRINDYKNDNEYYDSQINAFTTTLIIHLYKEAKNLVTEKRSKLIMSEINYYMFNNQSNKDLSLETMAKYFNVTPSYLSKFHKEHTNETFTTTLLRMRLTTATELLKNGYQVAEVASKAGFNSYANFYKQFKKYYNCTPLEYIKKLK